eukprot:scaffold8759_cov135-Isochrysis_galbana.AAC.6
MDRVVRSVVGAHGAEQHIRPRLGAHPAPDARALLVLLGPIGRRPGNFAQAAPSSAGAPFRRAAAPPQLPLGHDMVGLQVGLGWWACHHGRIMLAYPRRCKAIFGSGAGGRVDAEQRVEQLRRAPTPADLVARGAEPAEQKRGDGLPR